MEHKGMFNREINPSRNSQVQQKAMRQAMKEIDMQRFVKQLAQAHRAAEQGKSCTEVTYDNIFAALMSAVLGD